MATTTRTLVVRRWRDRTQVLAVTHPIAFALVHAAKTLVVDVPRRLWRFAR